MDGKGPFSISPKGLAPPSWITIKENPSVLEGSYFVFHIHVSVPKTPPVTDQTYDYVVRDIAEHSTFVHIFVKKPPAN
jgi:hypothetical protein